FCSSQPSRWLRPAPIRLHDVAPRRMMAAHELEQLRADWPGRETTLVWNDAPVRGGASHNDGEGVAMTRKKNNTLTADKESLIPIVERARRAAHEGHEQQAMKELSEWFEKWGHTKIGETIENIMSNFIMRNDPGQRRPRGRAFDMESIVLTVVALEKIGTATPTAKKQVADRFCTTVRNVELYLKKFGAAFRQIFNLIAADDSLGGLDWDHMTRLRLTQEEVRKLNEITFREK